MIFAPTFLASESEDGKKVTFTNTSFDVANDEGYVKSDFTTNELVLLDAYGETLDILSFLSTDVVYYNKATDLWVTAILQMTGENSYTKTQDFPFNRIAQSKHAKVLQSGKCHTKHKDNYCLALGYLFGAENDSYILGNEVSYQTNIDNANAYLDLLL